MTHPGGRIIDTDTLRISLVLQVSSDDQEHEQGSLRAARGPHAHPRLCRDARGRDGGVRQELGEGMSQVRGGADRGQWCADDHCGDGEPLRS
jgi:hypothetical protein